MICLCKERVQDKLTGEWYEANEKYTFTKERAEEVTMAANGRYFELVSEEEPVKEKTKKSKKSAE